MRKRSIIVLFSFFLLIGFLSCTSESKRKKLSSEKMEEILYDYYLAENLANRPTHVADRKNEYAYRLAVLKKHGVSKAEFDSSMVYYYRHTDELRKIYKNLSERINKEAMDVGLATQTPNSYASYSTTGDTAQVWKDLHSIVLTTIEPYNLHSFTIEIDTTYHKGDQILLNFDTQFIFQDGMRDGVALLAVQFNNDSIASQTVRMSSSSHFSLSVTDHKQLGIKRIRGYFMLNKDLSSNASISTLRLMNLYNIHMLRIHPKKEEPKAENMPDTLKRSNIQLDTLNDSRGRFR